MKPLSPVGVRATRGPDGSLRLQGRSRLRGVDESDWDSNRVTITEPRKNDGYRFDVRMRVFPYDAVALQMATPNVGGSLDWTWSAEQLATLLGTATGALNGTVAMQGALAGRETVWEQQ